jgi:hypothetical protein
MDTPPSFCSFPFLSAYSHSCSVGIIPLSNQDFRGIDHGKSVREAAGFARPAGRS